MRHSGEACDSLGVHYFPNGCIPIHSIGLVMMSYLDGEVCSGRASTALAGCTLFSPASMRWLPGLSPSVMTRSRIGVQTAGLVGICHGSHRPRVRRRSLSSCASVCTWCILCL